MYPYCRFSGINSRGRQTLPLLVMCILLLVSCSRHQEDEGKLIYAALNPLSPYLQSSIETHNQYHPEAQIEVRDYSDEAGLDRSLTSWKCSALAIMKNTGVCQIFPVPIIQNLQKHSGTKRLLTQIPLMCSICPTSSWP